jgi:polysaccharide pyruvyl transferase WcaK-like protein
MTSIKQQILSRSVAIYTDMLRFRRTIFRRRDRDSSVLILPPAAPGSLGDEALVTGAIEYLRDKGIKRIGVLSYDPKLQWKNLELVSGKSELHHHFLGGSLGSPKALFHFANAVYQYERFYCIGADVMDGYYYEHDTLQRVKFVSIANAMGVDTAVLGFSFNSQPKPRSVEALNNLPETVRLCVRDPVSHQRLVHHLKRPVELVADLAFLLQPIEDSETVRHVLKWIDEQRATNRIVLGINANYKLIENLEVKKIENLIQIYIDTIGKLYSKNKHLSFVLIPHDFRNIKGKNSDVVLAEAVWKTLPLEIQSYCLKVPTPCSAAEIKGIAGNLDMVLSGRMHLAIASLGQGTPAACITYQGKFEGLFNHFDLEGMTIEPEQALQPGNLVQFLMPLIEKRKDIRKHVQLKLPQIIKLSKANFDSREH